MNSGHPDFNTDNSVLLTHLSLLERKATYHDKLHDLTSLNLLSQYSTGGLK